MLTFPNDGQSHRYRVHVVAETVRDVVANVGGWLVDLSMAGWDVRVLLPDCDDDTPLQILGASSADLVTGPGSAKLNPLPDVWAVSTALYASNPWIRTTTMEAQHDTNCSTVLWGGICPCELERNFVSIRRQSSGAAGAFKTEAVMAAGGDENSAGVYEVLHTCQKPMRWAASSTAPEELRGFGIHEPAELPLLARTNQTR